MSTRRVFLIAGVAIGIAAFACGFNQATAQQEEPRQRQIAPESIITDAAGRVHNVMPMRRTTPEQRKAAAKRLKASMDAKAAKEKQETPASSQGGAK